MNKDYIIIQNEYEGIKVKELLENKNRFSSRLLNRLEIGDSIYLNGKKTKLKKVLKKGDIIRIDFLDEIDEYEKVEMPLDIIYEDLDLIVLNKKPFRVVHPTQRHQNDTTANAVSYYFFKNNIFRKVRFVNRLDMNTTGVLIIAKNPHAHNIISQDMRKNKIDKKYVAITEGILENKAGSINEKIARLGENIKREIHQSGKECVTHYKVIKEKNGLSLVDIKLETGRTHQIRVHFAHLGAPVLGDELYGNKNEIINRQALHCKSIEIIHPRSNQRIMFEADIPEDMNCLFSE